jgi:phage-related protein
LPPDKVLVWLHVAVRTPPFSGEARIESGVLLRRLQRGESLGPPSSRPMPSIGKRCHELRVVDANVTWRLVYRIDGDAIVISNVFKKKTETTPKSVIDACRQRYREYDSVTREQGL